MTKIAEIKKSAPDTKIGAEVVKSANMAIMGAKTPSTLLAEAASPTEVPLIFVGKTSGV